MTLRGNRLRARAFQSLCLHLVSSRGDLRAEDELGKRSPVRLQSPGPRKLGQANLFHPCFGYGEQIERV